MPKQAALRFGNDNKIRKGSLEVVGKLAMPKKEQQKVWLTLREYLQRVKGFTMYAVMQDPRAWLPIDDRDAMPLSPYTLLTPAEQKRLCDKDKLAGEALSYQSKVVEKKAREPYWAMPVKWILILTGSAFSIILLMVMLTRINPAEVMQNLRGFVPW